MPRRALCLTLVLLLPVLAGLLPAGAVTLTGPDSEGRLHVESDRLSFTVDTREGGRLSSLIWHDHPGETVYPRGGFCLDHFWEQPWPGEFLSAPYDFSVEEPAPGALTVTVSRTSTGRWGGTFLEPLSGLELSRRMTVREGSPLLEVEIVVHNPTAATRQFGYWAQHCFSPAGKLDHVEYFRPGALGISHVREDPRTRGVAAPDEVCYVRNPVAGWTATLDPEARVGYAFLMDYNELAWLYNCVGQNTTEWMYQRTVLPPGQTWSTAFTILPFAGLGSVAHACPEALIELQPVEKPDAVELHLALVSSAVPVRGLRARGEVLNLITGTTTPLPEWQGGALGPEPLRHTWIRPGGLHEQILVRLELAFETDGPPTTERFEFFYGGRLGFSGQNLRLDLSPIYVIPAPPRQRQYLKPEVVACDPQPGLHVVWGQGMFFDHYGVERALRRLSDVHLLQCEPYAGLLGEGLQSFPSSYEEMLRQDVIVLTNLSAAVLDDVTAELVKDFVEAGGGLLVCGGPWSLGKGSYAGSKLGDLLPVETTGLSDLRHAPAALSATAEFPWPDLSPERDRPWSEYLQVVRPRPQASVWLHCGEHPALITGSRGQGRVAVLALTPMGDPDRRLRPWWRWRHWPETLARTLLWLAGKEEQ